jgi:hypothetical protein
MSRVDLIPSFGELLMDEFDQSLLDVAYTRIDAAESKRVAGSTIWADVRNTWDVAPVVISARLNRLVSLGLLDRDEANSSGKTKVYAPTHAGYRAWRAVKAGVSV